MLKNILKINKQEKDDLKDHLFLSEMYAIEKIKGTHFRYRYKNNEWVITRPGNTELNYVDRTLMLFYEEIYKKISNIYPNKLSTKYTYSFKYNHENNKIYLTYILYRNNEIFNLDLLERYASIFNVDLPEIFFRGRLEEDDNINIDNISKVLKAKPPYIIKIRDAKYNYFIEESESDKSNRDDDLYYLTIIDFSNFLNDEDFYNYEIQGKEDPFIYINLINKLFLHFVNKNHSRYKDLEIDKPEFLNNKSFSLNMNNISNIHLKKLFNEYPFYKDIYQIILNAFRKEKKNTNKLFTSHNLNLFNTNVKRIQHLINQIKFENTNYREQKTFKHLQEKNNEVLNWRINFNYLTRSKVKALNKLYELKDKKIRVILPTEDRLEIMLEGLKGYEFIHDVVVNDNIHQIHLTDIDVVLETGIDITKDDNLNIDTMSFNVYKEIFPQSLHKFYQNRN